MYVIKPPLYPREKVSYQNGDGKHSKNILTENIRRHVKTTSPNRARVLDFRSLPFTERLYLFQYWKHYRPIMLCFSTCVQQPNVDFHNI